MPSARRSPPVSLCLVAVVCGLLGCDPLPTGAVQTTSGLVTGLRDPATNVASYLGIRYAASTAGEGRFALPEAAPEWSGVREAVDYGDACPQAPDTEQATSEDCLNLNVWAPEASAPLPVMVWVHGGGYIFGAGNDTMYDGAKLAARGDVVVVTLNYRLGALGFLTTPGEDGVPANLGIRDQVAALQWVNENIAAFGGDPDNVTVFGQSAGGGSVCSLLGVPAADDLFHRAIVQSGGGCILGTPDDAALGTALYEQSQAAIAEVGCDNAADLMACLRQPGLLDQLVASSDRPIIPSTIDDLIWTFPVVDGEFIEANPRDRMASGARDVPLMMGANSDEAFLGALPAEIVSQADYDAYVDAFFGEELGPQMVAVYPASVYGSPGAAWERLLGETLETCPVAAMTEAAAAGPHPSFAYHFSYGDIAPHGGEIGFLFGNTWLMGERLGVSEAIQDAWTSFARTGAPQLPGGWAAYSAGAPAIAVLDVPPTTQADVSDGRCAQLEALGVPL